MPSKRKATDVESSINTQLAPQPPPASTPTPAKRQRVSRACDQCRAAREKCDGVQPQCHSCVSQNRPCTYEANPKKRGVATGYIRTLELALAWIFDQISGTEDALDTAIAHENGRVRAIISGNDAGGADRLHKKWRKSRAHKGIDHILSGGTAVPSPMQDERSLSPDASHTEGEPTTVSPIPDDNKAERLSHLIPPTTVQQSMTSQLGKLPDKPPDISLEPRPVSFPADRLKLPPNHWRLLDIYFSYTHSWLPILEKQALFQTSYMYSEEGLDVNPGDANSALHAELWSALALASLQNSACSQSGLGEATNGRFSPKDIYDVARGLIPPEQGPFQINHARALILLSLVCLSHGDPTGASLLVGSGIRVALSIDPSDQDYERQRINPVLMGCFIVETILSARYNKLPHLREEDVSEVDAIPEDGVDQWEPWTPVDGFGSTPPNSRMSRNPAFCISTFNQLFAIIKVVSSDLSAKKRRIAPRGRTTASQLQEAFNPNPRFGNLMTPGGVSPVPTFYIIKAVYLWASTLADPCSESTITLLKDTLNQFQKLFGECAVPPILSACLASSVSQDHPATGRAPDREQLREPGLAPPGEERNLPATHLDLSSPLAGAQREGTGAGQYPSMANPIMSIDSLATGTYYNNSTIPQSSHHSDRSFGALSGQTLVTPYDQRRFSGSTASLPRNGSVDMRLGPSVTYRMANMDHGHHHLVSQGFGGNPDYDALLDDLASIECADPVDVDPQFMTNLGFAPGCDITEIFTRDFGGV